MAFALRTLALVLLVGAVSVPAAAAERLGAEECEVDEVAPTLDPQVSRKEPAREAQAPAQLAPSPGAPRAKDAVRVCAGDQAMVSCNAGSREAAPERVPLLRGLDPCLLAAGTALAPPPASLRGPAVLAESAPASRAPDRIERPPRA